MEKKLTSENKKISDKVGKLFDLYPLDLKDAREVSIAMREGLARMYGDPSLRAFLENSVRFANQNLIRSATSEQMMFYKARIETLLQLLAMGKQHFIHFEMLRMNVAKKQQVKKEVDTKLEVKIQ